MSEVNDCKIYVGNLPFSVGFERLKEIFAPFGNITDATVIADKFSGRSKGFGFVTFSKKEEADKAVNEMNGKDVEGRELRVNIARPKESREERPKEDATEPTS